MNQIVKFKIKHFDKNGFSTIREDSVISETMLHIVCNCKEIAIISSLPGMEKELACGYLLSNGIINSQKDILFCEFSSICETVQVEIAPKLLSKSIFSRKYVTSGCGAGFQVVFADEIIPLEFPFITFSQKIIVSAATELQNSSQLFRETGGVHSVALCDKTGEIIVRADDIGRHNAFDKIVGYSLLKNKINIKNCFAVCTGRLSSEIVIKAYQLQIPLIVSRSAPTSRGVVLAKKGNIGLVAFARNGRINIYHGKDRIVNDST